MQIVLGREFGFEPWRMDEVRAKFPEAAFPFVTDEPEAMANADAFIGRITPEAYANAGPGLKWVHSTGAGIETIIAIPGMVESDVTITNTRGAHAPFVAEHAFALLLSLNRWLSGYAHDQRNHTFRAYGRDVEMTSAYGKRALVLGMGNIGRAIAKRAAAFDMEVVGLDLFVPAENTGEFPVRSLDHLDEELATADVVFVAVPYTADTDDLLSAERIALLKPEAMVIGISRGRIINEDALVARLTAGTLAGAGLDVFSQEPLPADSPLWDTPNLVMTPHCAPRSAQTRDREFEITYENIRRFIAGEPLLNLCDKAAGF